MLTTHTDRTVFEYARVLFRLQGGETQWHWVEGEVDRSATLRLRIVDRWGRFTGSVVVATPRDVLRAYPAQLVGDRLEALDLEPARL